MWDYLLGESEQPKPPKNSVSEFSQSNRLNKRYRILKPIGQGGFGGKGLPHSLCRVSIRFQIVHN